MLTVRVARPTIWRHREAGTLLLSPGGRLRPQPLALSAPKSGQRAHPAAAWGEKAQVMGWPQACWSTRLGRLIIQTLAIPGRCAARSWARRLLEQVIREGREAGGGTIPARSRRRQPRGQNPLSGAGVSPKATAAGLLGPASMPHRLCWCWMTRGQDPSHELRGLPGHGHQGQAGALPGLPSRPFSPGSSAGWCGGGAAPAPRSTP